MNEYQRISRWMTWINALLAVGLVVNVAFAFWNFSNGRVVLGGISTGASLVALIALVKS